MNKSVLILGAGQIGFPLARLLTKPSGIYSSYTCFNENRDVHLADINEIPTKNLSKKCILHNVDVSNVVELKALCYSIEDLGSIISCLPYHLNKEAAGLAALLNLNYFDLTEDNDVTNYIKEISKGSDKVFVPQCGLAPGFVSIFTNNFIKDFDEIHDVNMRVGALPRLTNNDLKYSLTWSTNGLINECGNPCKSIVNGKIVEVQPLENLEHITLDGIEYEAFNTSGGIGTLLESYLGKVNNMNYKTMRYKGHRDLFKFLMFDLKLNQKREMFEEILNDAIPSVSNDVVIIYVSITGMIDGKLTTKSDYIKNTGYEDFTAIQTTTAAGIAAVVDIMLNYTNYNYKGFVNVEEISYHDFLANRFGSLYIADELKQKVGV